MIKLFDNWIIEVDAMNYSLAEYVGERTRIDKKGNERTETVIERYGYYRSLSEAIKALRDRIIRLRLQNSALSLSEALRAIREEDDRINELLSRIEVDDGK